jgi:hypothetical protein
MSDEGFLRRWSRLKADPAAAQAAAAAAPAPPPAEPRPEGATMPTSEPQPGRGLQPTAAGAPALPTLDDVARLDGDSDFSAFVAKGVDRDVRRLAMKKLFSDPHFNLIDRLDVYMDDYNKPSPMSESMLAALHHTKNLFAPLASAASEADADAGATAGAGEGAAATKHEASTADEPGAAATTVDTRAGTATTVDAAAAARTEGAPAGVEPVPTPMPATATAPVQREPMQFHGAAAGGALQQTLQGKA